MAQDLASLSGNRASLCAEMHGLPMVGSANAPYLSHQLTILLTCKNSLLTPVRIRAPRRNRTSSSPHMHNVCLRAADFGGCSAGFGDLAPFPADHPSKSAARARPRPTPTRPRPQPEIRATPAIAIHTTHSVAATPTRLQPPPRRPETNAHPVRHSLHHTTSHPAPHALLRLSETGLSWIRIIRTLTNQHAAAASRHRGVLCVRARFGGFITEQENDDGRQRFVAA